MVEAGLDDGNDLGGRWGFAWGVDLAAVAEGFEVRDFAGGVQDVEFGQGFWEGDVPGVDDSIADWGLRTADFFGAGRGNIGWVWVLG